MATRRARPKPPQSFVDRLKAKWLTLAVHLGCLATLAVLAWRYFNDDLGVDVVNGVYYHTGRIALILLALSLAVTPINFLFGLPRVQVVRRPLGLYAFLFAMIHFTNFIGLDYGFDLNMILQDAILNKPYILAGLGSLVILIALAATSTQGWQRRLKRGWTNLHRLVYVAALLAALHFFWQAKVPERPEPLLYGAVYIALLVVRIPPIRRWLVHTRHRLTSRRAKSTSSTPPALARSDRAMAGEEQG